jgi:thiol-disulfide isomerase/thioredoxin
VTYSNRTRALLTWSALAVCLSCAKSAPAGEIDPKARQLLDEVVSAYKGLPSYADHGTFVLSITLDGKANTQKQPASVAFVRPNKLRVEAGVASLVCDGTTFTTLVGPSKKYASEPSPKTVNFHSVAGGPAGSLLFGGPSGPPMLMVLGLLLAEDPARAVLDQGESLQVEGDREFDGAPSRVIKVVAANGTVYRLLIDPQSKLLRAIDVEPDAGAIASMFPPGARVKFEAFRWVAGKVSTEVAAEAFAAEMPKDFGKVGELPGAGKGDDEPKYKVEELVDKPAPAFTLAVLDGAGKSRTLDLKDLAGKVVMIDFWATWCGPCLAELPEVQKLIEGYAKDKKDVVVVALSEDNDPKELAAVRKLVEETLEKKKIVLTADPVGKIGLDPSNSVGEAFKVEGYPTVVILDGKGVVRAAHVGYSPEVGKILSRDIDALLAGKPVPKKGDDEKEKDKEKK